MTQLSIEQKLKIDKINRLLEKGNTGILLYLLSFEDSVESKFDKLKEDLKGDSYELTEKDKKEIRNLFDDKKIIQELLKQIEIPTIDEIAKRTAKYVKVEKPQKINVTKIVKQIRAGVKTTTVVQGEKVDLEKLKKDIENDLPKFGERIRDGLELLPNGKDETEDLRLDKSAIKGLDDYDDMARYFKEQGKGVVRIGGGKQNFYQMNDVNLDGVTNGQVPVYNSTLKLWLPGSVSSGTAWGSITGTLSAQTDLQTALNAKENSISAGTTLQYWRGDKSWQTLNTAVVPESGNLYYTQTRFDNAIAVIKGVNNGIASLDGSGKVPTSQLPALALTDVFVVASQVAQLALTAEEGDVAIRTDLNKSYIHNGGTAGTMADWNELLTPTDSVLSVNGFTGAVTLTTSNIAEGSNLYYTNTRADARIANAIGVSVQAYLSGTGFVKSTAGVISYDTSTYVTGPGGADGDLQINNSGVFGTLGGLNLNKTGNARGTSALDIQSSRSVVTQVASGTKAVALGVGNTASANYSTAVGSNTTASGLNSSSFGTGISSTNTAGTTVGSGSSNSGSRSTSCGYSNTMTSGFSAVLGGKNVLLGSNLSTASGYRNTVSGLGATASGYQNTASGQYSLALGSSNNASATKATAIGANIANSTANSVEIGPANASKIRISSAGLDLVTLPIRPATLADASAPVNSIYYSSTASKLVYKDAGGTVNNLY